MIRTATWSTTFASKTPYQVYVDIPGTQIARYVATSELYNSDSYSEAEDGR